MLRKIPQETRKKLEAKGYFPQDGYILQHLPVPPNCLSVPDISDGMSVTSTVRRLNPLFIICIFVHLLADCHNLVDVQDYSTTLLKKVLKQVEVIKNSRSGMPNFESHEIEANDLQAAVAQYLEFRGTGKVLFIFLIILFMRNGQEIFFLYCWLGGCIFLMSSYLGPF